MDDTSLDAPVDATSPWQRPTPAPDQGTADERAYPPGSRFPLLPGVRSSFAQTSRLRTHYYESGTAGSGSVPLVLVHGNASSARFFEEFMARLPQFYIVAPDLRGYGASEALPVDATRGLRDFSDDLHALVETLGLERFHLLGWSLGGNIAMQYVIDHPEHVRSLTLHATGSPYGFGGTAGVEGHANYADFAGSGGGLISPEIIARYQAQDVGTDSPFAPRNGLRQGIVKPGFTFTPEREDALVEQMLMMRIGDQFYPGDSQPSANWPGFAPGVYGANNALSPKYPNQAALGDLRDGPPILWLRGTDDALVSDASFGDPAMLGKLGMIPGWPGEEVCPPQPMVSQIRAVLDRYRANGGVYTEAVFSDCGHAPLIEKPDETLGFLLPFLLSAQSQRGHETRTSPAAAAAPVASGDGDSAAAEVPSIEVAAAPLAPEAPAIPEQPLPPKDPVSADVGTPADPPAPIEPAASVEPVEPVASVAAEPPVPPVPPTAPLRPSAPVAAAPGNNPTSPPATPSMPTEHRGFLRRLFGR